uniref:RING-type E3 ubiquitin transferase n=1 Tax=Chromera velia CCMP2878 TaxID=1169474 RepID=A0A0G4HHK0_9ALVE|eukprot:Cvel_6823.t1-p1 / transcript=Cvel_6823.t1 / gene=Cvel_6823 / organism=Chromera_velia_CCMP2878 / gene_product=hypothetical protein / transcript_product=hypothetical protein / location=Cvel_scaffold344:16088-19126(-) / protein_length=638 / sequence_SO=supercontig / SO=protein_coding / is_pseudo=false
MQVEPNANPLLGDRRETERGPNESFQSAHDVERGEGEGENAAVNAEGEHVDVQQRGALYECLMCVEDAFQHSTAGWQLLIVLVVGVVVSLDFVKVYKESCQRPLAIWVVLFMFRHLLSAGVRCFNVWEFRARGHAPLSPLVPMLEAVGFGGWLVGWVWGAEIERSSKSCNEELFHLFAFLWNLQLRLYVGFLIVTALVLLFLLGGMLCMRCLQKRRSGRRIVERLERIRYADLRDRYRARRAAVLAARAGARRGEEGGAEPQGQNEGEGVGRTGGGGEGGGHGEGEGAAPRGGEVPDRVLQSRSFSDYPPECIFCIEPFQDDTSVLVMPCEGGHFFCAPCIARWLQQSRQCPVCRTDVVDVIENRDRDGEGATGGRGGGDGESVEGERGAVQGQQEGGQEQAREGGREHEGALPQGGLMEDEREQRAADPGCCRCLLTLFRGRRRGGRERRIVVVREEEEERQREMEEGWIQRHTEVTGERRQEEGEGGVALAADESSSSSARGVSSPSGHSREKEKEGNKERREEGIIFPESAIVTGLAPRAASNERPEEQKQKNQGIDEQQDGGERERERSPLHDARRLRYIGGTAGGGTRTTASGLLNVSASSSASASSSSSSAFADASSTLNEDERESGEGRTL